MSNVLRLLGEYGMMEVCWLTLWKVFKLPSPNVAMLLSIGLRRKKDTVKEVKEKYELIHRLQKNMGSQNVEMIKQLQREVGLF